MTDVPVRLLITAEGEAAEAELRALGYEVRRVGEAAATATAGAGPGIKQISDQSRVAVGQVGNLAAQFNDIGVMLAAGQSPLQLAIQQGTQISQVLGPLGAGQAVRSLLAAFTSLFNPVSLITIASIAGGAAMVQWLTEAGEEARTLEDIIGDLNDAMSKLAAARKAAATPFSELQETYGAQAEAARELFEIERQLAEMRAQGRFAEAAANSSAALGASGFDGQSSAQIARLGEIVKLQRQQVAEDEAAIERLRALGRARTEAENAALQAARASRGAAIALLEDNADVIEGIQDLVSTLGVSEESAFKLAAAMAEIRDAGSVEEQAAAAQRLAQAIFEATEGFTTGKVEAHDLYEALLDAAKAGLDLSKLDIASGISAAASQAARLAEWLGISLSRALALSNLTPGLADEDAAMSQSVLPDASQRASNRAAVSNLNRLVLPRSGGGGGGGGGANRDGFAALSAEADRALADLTLAIAGINEKVAAGLKTTGEGQEAVRSAIASTADQIADLIPKLDQAAEKAGPGAKAKVAELRAELKGLAGDLDQTARDLSKTFSDSLGRAMTDFTTGTKDAGDAFQDFGRTVLSEINRILAQRFTQRFITPLIDSLFSFLPAGLGLGGAPAAAAAPSLGLAALTRPAALTPAIRTATASAALAARSLPQPLPERLSAPVTVNVTNAAPGAQARATERNDGQGRTIDVMVEQIEAGIAANMRRGVGPVSDVLGSTFGVGRVPR